MSDELRQFDAIRPLLIALVDDRLGEDERMQLADMLRGDPAARTYYLHYMLADAMLRLEYNPRTIERASGEQSAAASRQWPVGSGQWAVGSGQRAVCDDPPSALRPPPSSNPQSLIPNPSPVPFIVVDNTLPSPLSPLPSFLFSYTVATVIFVIAGLCGWLYQVEHYTEFARTFGTPSSPATIEQPARVGRITGMVECRWETEGLGIRDWGLDKGSGRKQIQSLIPNPQSPVRLGDKFALASGLLQLTYDSGANVILQGPCTYEVESKTGGFLSLGKLTAKIGERGEGRGERGEKQVVSGQWSVAGKSNIQHPTSNISNPQSRNPQISNPQSLIPNPLFVVRTPTAIVTDLGTEFGVEVSEKGITTSHVFGGRVEVRLAGGNGSEPAIQLGENESARVEFGQGRVPTVTRDAAQPHRFVRGVPRQVPIELFSTGVDAAEGQPDPHWQVVARSDDPGFRPQPAMVTPACEGWWLPNNPGRGQWISLVGDGSPVRNEVVYTFRTTFQLAGVRPETARLRGLFLVDNRVRAIRLNGQAVTVPEHPYNSFDLFRAFTATSGFVEGANVLEIDVENGNPERPAEQSEMGLRVDLEGTAQQK